MKKKNIKIEKEINKIIESFRLKEIKKYEKEKEKPNTIALLILFLRLNFNLDMGEELEYICDGTNDKGVDAIYISDEVEEIYFIQSKYKFTNKIKGFDTNIKSFSVSVDGLIKQIKERKYDKDINKDLKSLIDSLGLEEKINDYQYNKIFITNIDTKSHFNDTCNNLEIKLVDEKDFLNMLNNTNKLTTKNIDFTFKNIDNILQLRNEKAILFELSTKKFVSEVEGINDYSLFDLNVRSWLGKGKIYKSIKQKLKELKEAGISQLDNSLYHNGITMICNDYQYNSEKKQIIAKNIKIINGAQSIYAFYDNKDLLDNDHTILIKLIKTNDENLIKTISYFSNNQAHVRIRDLRSLHQKIISLQNLFKNSIKYKIKTKAGRDNVQNNSELIVVEFDKLAQLIVSFYLNKSYIAHNKSKILDEYFHEIFSNKFNKEHYEFLLDIHFEVEKFLKNKKETTSNESDIILSSLYLTEFFILDTLSYLIKELFKKNFYTLQDFNEIIKNFNNKEKWIEYIKIIFNKIKYHLTDENGLYKGEDYRKIIKNKDTNINLKQKIIKSFKESIKTESLEKLI